MSLLARIKRAISGAPDPTVPEPASRHDRREAGRERHHETGEPAWEASDRVDEPAGAGKGNPDSAPEIFGGG